MIAGVAAAAVAASSKPAKLHAVSYGRRVSWGQPRPLLVS